MLRVSYGEKYWTNIGIDTGEQTAIEYRGIETHFGTALPDISRFQRTAKIQRHIEQAAKAGANEQEVLEAVEVGIEMGGGPATVSARFALDVMDTVYNK